MALPLRIRIVKFLEHWYTQNKDPPTVRIIAKAVSNYGTPSMVFRSCKALVKRGDLIEKSRKYYLPVKYCIKIRFKVFNGKCKVSSAESPWPDMFAAIVMDEFNSDLYKDSGLQDPPQIGDILLFEGRRVKFLLKRVDFLLPGMTEN